MNSEARRTHQERAAARERSRARRERERSSMERRAAERAARPPQEYDCAAKLAALMQLRGLTQSGLSRLTGGLIHQTRISRWIRGAGEPNLCQLEALSVCLRVPLAYWWTSRTEAPDRDALEREYELERHIRELGPSAALDRLMLKTLDVLAVRPVEAAAGGGDAAGPRLHKSC